MRRIRYERHFPALILAGIILWFVLIFDTFPTGIDRLGFYFGLIGALHATSLVISLRDRRGAAAKIAFLALAAILSVVTPFSMIVPAWMTSHLTMLGESGRFFLSLSLASAFGASGYWLLVKLFWWKSLKMVDLVMTVAMCASATCLSWVGAGMLMPGPCPPCRADLRDVLPTVAWWAAFSLSLYLSEDPPHFFSSHSRATSASGRCFPSNW